MNGASGGLRAQVASIAAGLPVTRTPFGVLIEADDAEWRDSGSAKKMAKQLLNAGCRFIVCFGHDSERVHDLIDEVVESQNQSRVVTTFHNDESRPEVLAFFQQVVSPGMKGALIWVRDVSAWGALLL